MAEYRKEKPISNPSTKRYVQAPNLQQLINNYEEVLIDTSFTTPSRAFYQLHIYPLRKHHTLPSKTLDEFTTYAQQITSLFSNQQATTSKEAISEMDDLYDLLHEKNQYLNNTLHPLLSSYEELINQAEKTSFEKPTCKSSEELLEEVASITHKTPSLADKQLLSKALQNNKDTLLLTRDSDFLDALTLLHPLPKHQITAVQYHQEKPTRYISTREQAA